MVFVVDCVICDGLNNIGIEGGPDDGGGISVGSRWNNRKKITNHRMHCDWLVGSFMVLNVNFQNYFSYIVVVSFIGGGNRSISRKPPTCLSQVTDELYHIMLYIEQGSNSQLQLLQALIEQVVVNPTTIP